MKLFFSATTFCIVSVTLVQAAPVPTTEFLQSSIRAINKGFDSMLDSVCASCILKSDIEEIGHSPLTKKQRLDTVDSITDIKTNNHDQVAEAMVPPGEQVKASNGNNLINEPSGRQLESDFNKEIAAAALLDFRKGNSLAGSVPANAQFRVANPNVIESRSEVATGRGQDTFRQSSQEWGEEMNGKSVSFGPEVTTHDSRSLLELENDLSLAQMNARESEFESTTALANIGQVNEMWSKQIGREANPLKTQTVKFNFANQ
jgi:hypothetical protein